MSKPVVLIAGGDLRQYYLAQILASDHTVYTTGLEKCESPFPTETDPQLLHTLPPLSALILPMPAASEPGVLNTPFSSRRIRIESLLACIPPDTAVFGGRMDEALLSLLKQRRIQAADYLKREPLAIRNAAVTAEGAIGIAIESMPRTLDGAQVLLLGYGRIGRCLARKLSALGAAVTVAARSKEALAWAETEGCRTVPFARFEELLPQTDLLFNTVPAEVLTADLMHRLPKDCLLIDLASLPGGFDLLCAQKMGLRSIRALSLPGRTAPYTAAAIIAQEIRELEEERRLHDDTP